MAELENFTADDLKGKSRADLLAICKERGYKATGWDKGKMLAVLTGEEAPPVSKTERKKKVEKAIKERKSSGSDEPATGKETSAQERMKARTGRCEAIGCTCEVWLPNGMDGNRFWPTCACGHTQWVHAKPEDTSSEPQGYRAPSQDAVEAPAESDETAGAQPEDEAAEAPEEADAAAEEQA